MTKKEVKFIQDYLNELDNQLVIKRRILPCVDSFDQEQECRRSIRALLNQQIGIQDLMHELGIDCTYSSGFGWKVRKK